MNRAAFEIDTDALHAYADGQLNAGQRAAVEAWLAAHPDAAALVAQWSRQNDALRTLYDPVASEAVPPRLSPHRRAQSMRTERRHRLRNLAAAIGLFIVSAGAGWIGHDYLVPVEAASDRLIDQAVSAHSLYVRENTHAVEVPAGAPNLMRWLSNRIRTPIDAPRLAEQGFTFIGGRLLPGAPDGGLPGPAAQLMYENASAQRVTLYITAPLPDRSTAWKFESRGGVEAYYWANGAVTCTIVADLPAEDLRTLGKAIFEQLTRKADSSWNPGLGG